MIVAIIVISVLPGVFEFFRAGAGDRQAARSREASRSRSIKLRSGRAA